MSTVLTRCRWLKNGGVCSDDLGMTHTEFEALVNRLERYAARSPHGYRLRVALLACLGYASLFTVIALVSILIGGVIAVIALPQHPVFLIKFLVGPLILAASLLRSLKVTLTEPEGLKIERTDAPRLFSLLDEIRSTLSAPPFHQVLLTREMNAAVCQIPRFGLFGGHKNFLMLGLPLMQALTPAQFKAVVAHEVGHLSGNHGRFSGWVHRIRLIWLQVLENLRRDKHRRAAAWLGRFFSWYAPYFSAYTFVLARQNEYEADRCSAEIAGVSDTAQALIASQVQGQFWEEQFWPGIRKQSEQVPVPPPVFTTLTAAFQTHLLSEDAEQFYSHALSRKTSTADTHPALADRLRGLSYDPSPDALRLSTTTPNKETASACYLGASEMRLLEQVENEWRALTGASWQQCYQQAQKGRAQLQALEEKAQEGALSETDNWARACLTADFGERETAERLFRQIVSEFPGHAEAQMALGQLLLEQGNSDGLAFLTQAMNIEPDQTLTVCKIAWQFCRNQNLDADAETFRQRSDDRRQLLGKAQAEREVVEQNARFEAHELSSTALAELTEQLQDFRDIKCAYLVKKKVQYLPEHPLYVLWIVPPFITGTSHQKIVNLIAPKIKFAGQMRIYVVDSSDLRVLKIQRTLKTALIYRKGRR